VSLVVLTGDANIGTGALFEQDWRELDPPYASWDIAFEIQYEVIPEPTTCTLLGLGSLVLVMGRRRW